MEYMELSDSAYNIWLFQALERDVGEGHSPQTSAPCCSQPTDLSSNAPSPHTSALTLPGPQISALTLPAHRSHFRSFSLENLALEKLSVVQICCKIS